MDFAKLAEERYSVRKFSGRPVEREKLDLVLQAGLNAPTACNNQPQRILILDGADDLEKLGECTPYTFGAPTALLICFDESKSWVRPFDQAKSGLIDASIVTTQMMLQAADLGLGTTWVGYFEPVKIKAAFGLPDAFVPAAILPLGYPAADAAKNPLHFKKLPPEEVVFRHDFSRRA
ncbi:MAG: nitroreductase family protein [Planctomycetota bacterium]|jgi:nitroreductase|nr:nitroreductase family protein [Planctomycetota bacterium]